MNRGEDHGPEPRPGPLRSTSCVQVWPPSAVCSSAARQLVESFPFVAVQPLVRSHPASGETNCRSATLAGRAFLVHVTPPSCVRRSDQSDPSEALTNPCWSSTNCSVQSRIGYGASVPETDAGDALARSCAGSAVTTSSTRANAPSTTAALASKTRAVVLAVLRSPIRTRPLLRAAAGCASDLDTRKGI